MTDPVILDDLDALSFLDESFHETPFNETQPWSTNFLPRAENADPYAACVNPLDVHKCPPPLRPTSDAMLIEADVLLHDLLPGESFSTMFDGQVGGTVGQRISAANELLSSGHEHSRNLKRSRAGGELESDQDDNPSRHRRPSSEPPPDKARPKSKRQRIDEEEWNKHRAVIEFMYNQSGNTLADVMSSMKVNHNFNASKTAYKERLKFWDVTKTLKRYHKIYMWQKSKQRKEAEGKKTKFRYNKKEVPMSKITRLKPTPSEEALSAISTPSNLSIVAPSERSRRLPIRGAKSRDQSRSNLSIAVSSSPERESQYGRREKQVVINERSEHLPDSEPADSPTSIEDRLTGHAWTHKLLFQDLSAISQAQLASLTSKLIGSRSHWATDLLLEHTLARTEEQQVDHDTKPHETQKYEISLTRTLVLQHQYWKAGSILKGMCVKPDFYSFRFQHRLTLLKLRLLVDVGEEFEEPRILTNIETRCMALLAEETNEKQVPSRSCTCPTNLILAYLFRLCGIKGQKVSQCNVAKMEETLETQLTRTNPTLSIIWAAQQYVRWCLQNGQANKAGKTLRAIDHALRALGLRTGPEVDQNRNLTKVQQSRWSRVGGGCHLPDEVDGVLVYDRGTVDHRWLKLFKEYVWDEPHTCPDDVYKRTKEDDGTYFR